MTSLNKHFYRDNGNKGIYNVAQNKPEKNMTLKTGTSFKNRGTLSVTSLMLLKKSKYKSLVYFTGKPVQTTAEKKPDKMA